jgi:hypothetical protein
VSSRGKLSVKPKMVTVPVTRIGDAPGTLPEGIPLALKTEVFKLLRANGLHFDWYVLTSVIIY